MSEMHLCDCNSFYLTSMTKKIDDQVKLLKQPATSQLSTSHITSDTHFVLAHVESQDSLHMEDKGISGISLPSVPRLPRERGSSAQGGGGHASSAAHLELFTLLLLRLHSIETQTAAELLVLPREVTRPFPQELVFPQ